MHSAGLELTKLTYTRLEDNLIRHRGDRLDKDIGRRLPLQLQCSYQSQQGDFSQSMRGNYKTRF